MNQDISQLRSLIETCIQNKTFQVSDEALHKLLKDKSYEHQIRQLLLDIALNDAAHPDAERIEYVFKKIESEIDQEHSADKKGPTKTRRIKLPIRYTIAAALLVMFTATMIIYRYGRGDQLAEGGNNIVDSTIEPGKTRATLTLANGQKIILGQKENGEIAKEPGVSIVHNASGALEYKIIERTQSTGNQMNTLATANGETIKVILPDGTSVWLNAASSLTYPSVFNHDKSREVSLIGEAYFEAKHDARHAFIVNSQNQRVEVVGTHFNINCYDDEPAVKTTLLEGSVRVSANGNQAKLKPGFASVNNGRSLEVEAADTEVAVAWKNDLFLFESEDIHTVMRMISRWYDVEVVYQGSPITEKLSGGVQRFDKLSKVLGILKSTGQVQFRVEGRTVYVFK